MITILALREPIVEASEAAEPSQPRVSEAGEESEFVVGPLQMAGMALVAIVALTVVSVVAYTAGKLKAIPAPAVVMAAPPALRVVEPALPVAPAVPLFGDPTPGKLYMQIGALDKPAAIVFAEGLRTHSLEAFVAPGPGEKTFRVLVGPLEQGTPYLKAKEEVQRIGFDPMAHRY